MVVIVGQTLRKTTEEVVGERDNGDTTTVPFPILTERTSPFDQEDGIR